MIHPATVVFDEHDPAANARLLALLATHGRALIEALEAVLLVIDHDPLAPFCHQNQVLIQVRTVLDRLACDAQKQHTETRR
jgi:hypothetical protein